MTTLRFDHPHQPLYFILIGGLAALVHLSLVYMLVSLWQWPPLLANIFGFLLAFQVSFLGHRHLTFGQQADQKKLRMPRFFLVAGSAGLLNECLYFILLHYTPIPWLPALILVLGLVAIYTFISARIYALS